MNRINICNEQENGYLKYEKDKDHFIFDYPMYFRLEDLRTWTDGFYLTIYVDNKVKGIVTSFSFEDFPDEILEKSGLIFNPEGVFVNVNGQIRKLGTGDENKTHLRSAGIMLLENEKTMILLRNAEHKKYHAPGGCAEIYETPEETAVRELFEETAGSIRLKPSDLNKMKYVTVNKDEHTHRAFILNIDHFDEDIFRQNLQCLKNNKAEEYFLEMDNIIKTKSLHKLKLHYGVREIMKKLPENIGCFHLKPSPIKYHDKNLQGIKSFFI